MTAKLVWALVAMLAMMPIAAAQESGEEKPSEEAPPRDEGQAWADDCPPDMMCAFGGSPEETEDKPTYDDSNCPPDMYCASNVNETEGRGPADCEYCRGAESNETTDGPGSGHEEGGICVTMPEACYSQAPPQDGEVQPVSAQDDSTHAKQESSSEESKNTVPTAGVFATLGALLAVAGIALVRRS